MLPANPCHPPPVRPPRLQARRRASGRGCRAWCTRLRRGTLPQGPPAAARSSTCMSCPGGTTRPCCSTVPTGAPACTASSRTATQQPGMTTGDTVGCGEGSGGVGVGRPGGSRAWGGKGPHGGPHPANRPCELPTHPPATNPYHYHPHPPYHHHQQQQQQHPAAAVAETGLHEALLQSEHRTLDPEEADFFYIPAYTSCCECVCCVWGRGCADNGVRAGTPRDGPHGESWRLIAVFVPPARRHLPNPQ